MKNIQKHLTNALKLAEACVIAGIVIDPNELHLMRKSLLRVLRATSGLALRREYYGEINRAFMHDNFAIVRYVVETEGRLSLFKPKSKESFTRMCGAIVATYEPLISTIDGKTHRSPGQLLQIGASFCSAKHAKRFSKREALFRAIQSIRPLNMAWMDSPTKLPYALAALLYGVVGSDAPSSILKFERANAGG